MYKINDFMIWDDFTTEEYGVEWSYIKGGVDKKWQWGLIDEEGIDSVREQDHVLVEVEIRISWT